jgi:MFS family permease
MKITSPSFAHEIEKNYRHNFIVNFFDGTAFWFGASFFAYRTILPVYIANLTDSEFAIALLSTIIATGWLLPQLFTANWTQRLPLKKYAPVTIGFWSERLPIFLLVPSAWLATISMELALVASMICVAWHIIGAGIIAVGWQDMIAKIFPVDRRGKFFGITNFGGTATGILGASTVAWLLGRHEFPYSYMLAFLFGSIFIFISWVFLALTKEPLIEAETPHVSNREYWKQLPTIVRQDANFRRYLITQIFTGAGNMALGFLAVYAVQRWNLPDSQAGIFTIAMLVGQALSNLVFGWLADRKGHKLILEISVLTTVIGSGIAAIAPSDTWFLVVFFLTGVSAAGFMLSGIMIIFEFCQPEIRPTYIGINNTFNGLVAIFMPLLGGWLAKTFNYPVMFTVTFSICLVGLILLRFWVREPRHQNLETLANPVEDTKAI